MALVVSLLLAALVVLGVVVVGTWGDRGGGSPMSEVLVDEPAVADWNRRVAPALADLNGVRGVPGLRAEGPASAVPCSVDSGELFDPSAGRSWAAVAADRDAGGADGFSVTPETARGFKDIIRQLSDRGWDLEAREAVLGMNLPDGLLFDTVHLERTVDDTTVGMVLQVFDTGVHAGVGFDGAQRACRLSRG